MTSRDAQCRFALFQQLLQVFAATFPASEWRLTQTTVPFSPVPLGGVAHQGGDAALGKGALCQGDADGLPLGEQAARSGGGRTPVPPEGGLSFDLVEDQARPGVSGDAVFHMRS